MQSCIEIAGCSTPIADTAVRPCSSSEGRPVSSFLYDLGRSCFHRRKTTVGVWLALLAVIAGCVALFADSFQDDFDLPGA